MSEKIEIHIGPDEATRHIGTCHMSGKRGQSSVFSYTDEWLDRPDAFALDPANLPLNRNPHHTHSEKSALPGAVRDAAPDRWGRLLVKRAFRKLGEIRTLSEIDYLMAIDDRTRLGAMRLKREGDEDFGHETGPFRIPPLVQLPALLNAANAIHGNTETAEDIKLLLNEGSPLGGARPKAAVIDTDGSLSLAKFPKPDDDRSIPHGEILALTLAKKAGINVASGRLEKAAGRSVALITRFDRDGERRIPFLSAMSLLGLDDGDAAPYTDIAECIRMYSSAPTEDLNELWRRVVFSVKIGNLDDHLRNHGFLYNGDGKWRLSPAYDLNPVPVEEKARELTTWISEEGPEADIGLALRAAPRFALKEDQAAEIVSEIVDALQGWRDIARKLGMTAADTDAYATAIDEVKA